MMKLVNGVEVQMTEQEVAEFEASRIPVDTIPQRVTALQGLLAIDEAGMATQYQAWATSPSREFAERAYIDKALHWDRTDPVLIAGATALGLTSDELDALFVSAATK
jgi:hypothetical protein